MNDKLSDNIWERVYNIDAIGLMGCLNEYWQDGTFSSSQHGERLYHEEVFASYDPDSGDMWAEKEDEIVFYEWSKWREEVGRVFDGFVDWADENGYTDEDELCKVLVYRVCSTFSLVDDNECQIPEHAEKFFF